MKYVENNISPVKVWITAVRPFAYPATVTPVLLGLALSYFAGFPVNWPFFVLTLVGVLCFHTAGNLLNDCFDFTRGLDTQILPTSGAVVRGWLSVRQVYAVVAGLLVVGTACGLLLVYYTGWVLFVIGVLGMFLCLTYTTPGPCFKYTGFGDALIFVAFGLLPVYGTWWVQTQTFSWLPFLWSVPIACFTVGILHTNNWRDIESDEKKGCRTHAVLLGEKGSAHYYWFLMTAPFVLVVLYLFVAVFWRVDGLAPKSSIAVLLVLPVVVNLMKISLNRGNADFPMLDARTAQAQMMFGLLLPIAFVVG